MDELQATVHPTWIFHLSNLKEMSEIPVVKFGRSTWLDRYTTHVQVLHAHAFSVLVFQSYYYYIIIYRTPEKIQPIRMQESRCIFGGIQLILPMIQCANLLYFLWRGIK